MFDRISIDRDGDERQFIADTATKILIAMLAGRHSPAEKNVNDYVRLSYEASELLLEQIYKRPLKKRSAK